MSRMIVKRYGEAKTDIADHASFGVVEVDGSEIEATEPGDTLSLEGGANISGDTLNIEEVRWEGF